MGNILFNYTPTSLTEIVVFVNLCVCHPDDDFVQVEACRRDISDK
jgi:hypothetical protein